jgi:hypothetical protein
MIMLKQTSAVALLLTTFSIAVAMSPGCGSDGPSRPSGTAGAGGGTAGSGTAGAGTAGSGTAGEGTAGAGTAGAGTAGAGTAGAGTAGVDGGSAGAGTAGAGTAGAGTAGAAPPVVTAATAVLEIDDVIVSLKAGADGGVDGAVADGGVDGSADGVVADGGVDGSADGGSDGPAATPAVGVSYTFNTSTIGVDGWHYTPYGSTPTNDPNGAENLANESTALSPLAWIGTDDADGLSTSGSIKGTVPFQFQGDQIDFQAFSQATAKYNWSGYKLTAKVKLVSGGNKAYGCPLSASAYISQVGYATANSTPVNLVTGQWVTVTFDLDTAITSSPSADDSQVTQMGLQINTGPTCVGTTPPDAGTDTAPTDGGTDVPVDAPASDVASGN